MRACLRVVYALCAAVTVFVALGNRQNVAAGVSPFTPLPGLEDTVEFWKQIFVHHSYTDVVFFDPFDPSTVYSVLKAPDTDDGRALIEKERLRIIADYGLNEDEGRVKTQRGAREPFMNGVKISGRYIGQMQKIFQEEGLPSELAYLPFVESSFNVRARSSVGALGIWQFMVETGKKFLRITDVVDERRDPLLSTRAAARLLKENYQLLGNWPLAITAYNHGTDGIFKAISSVESDNLVDIIKHYQSPTFGFASKNFYAEFLAAVDIANHRDEYFPFLRLHSPTLLRELEMKKPLPVGAVLKPAAISEDDFFDWNPALNPGAKLIPAGYRVKLPAERIDGFLSAQRRITVKANAPKVNAVAKSALGPANGRPSTASKSKIAQRPEAQITSRLPSRRSHTTRSRLSAPPLRLAERQS
jgi:peptidoglycan lytic transglycosylase D